jgi:ribonuclease D
VPEQIPAALLDRLQELRSLRPAFAQEAAAARREAARLRLQNTKPQTRVTQLEAQPRPRAPRTPEAAAERTNGESHVFESATQICQTVLPRQAVPASVASSGAVGGDLACTDSLTLRVRPVLGVPRKLARPER